MFLTFSGHMTLVVNLAIKEVYQYPQSCKAKAILCYYRLNTLKDIKNAKMKIIIVCIQNMFSLL